jgi:TniQ
MGTSHQATPVPELRDLFGEKRLPVKVEPLEDELFSSWFVRSAQANGLRVHQLEHSLVERGRPLFAGDPDRGVWQSHARALAAVMDLPFEVASNTVLKSYEGNLWASVPDHGVWQNVLPAASANRHEHLHGVQYCPECLRTDQIPYYRKHWRLAFCVVCDLHKCLMHDRCPRCSQPIVLHRLNAENKRLKTVYSLNKCYACGESLICQPESIDENEDLVQFQKTLLMTLRRGWISIEGRCVHSVLFFQGLRMLISFLEEGKRSRSLIESISPGIIVDAPATKRYGGYEACSLTRRYEIIRLVCVLMKIGAEEMALLFARCGIRLQDINRFHMAPARSVPFWLWEPMYSHINGTLYTPTEQEIEQAVQYALSQSDKVRLEDVCRLLNFRTRSNTRVAIAWQKVKLFRNAQSTTTH